MAEQANARPSSIDDVVTENPMPQNPGFRPETPGGMTYDDAMRYINAQNSQRSPGGLERKIGEKPAVQKEDTGWTFRQVAKDALKFSPFMIFNFLASGGLAYLTGGMSLLAASSSFLPMISYSLGRYIENKKLKKKTTWYEIRKEMGTGNFVGNLAYWLYQIPEFLNISGATWGGKILRALSFNPGMLIPFVALYQPVVYLRDKIGVKKSLKGLYNGKIGGYLKEAYQKDMKKNFWPTVKQTFLTLFPIHLYSLNYVKTPSIRVGIGGLNDVIFRLIAGVKKEGEETPSAAKEKAPIMQRIKSFYRSIPSRLDNFFRVPGYEPPYKPAEAYSH
jgi:hypothetical protein